MVGVEGFEPPNNGIKIRGLNRLTIHQCVGDSGENRTHQRMNKICTSTALRFKLNLPHSHFTFWVSRQKPTSVVAAKNVPRSSVYLWENKRRGIYLDVSFCFVLIVCKQDHTLDKKPSHYLSFLIAPCKG